MTSTSTDVSASGSTSASIFDRLGGFEAVSAVVEDFYRRILHDDNLAHFFRNANMQNLMTHQIRFLKFALTRSQKNAATNTKDQERYGKYMDVPSMLLEKHMELFVSHGLNEKHFDMVLLHLSDTLKSFDLDYTLMQETLRAVAPLRSVFHHGARTYGRRGF